MTSYKHYDITFEAKTKGALGVSEKFNETVFAESVSAAIDSLYTDYDHVRPIEVYCHEIVVSVVANCHEFARTFRAQRDATQPERIT